MHRLRYVVNPLLAEVIIGVGEFWLEYLGPEPPEPSQRAPLATESAPSPERPLLERQIATIAGKHDIGGLVQQRADPLIAVIGKLLRASLKRFMSDGEQRELGQN